MNLSLPTMHSMTDALRRRLGPVVAEASDADPLHHPALRGLSPHELADLPLPWPAPRQAGSDALGPGDDLSSPCPD